MDIWDYLSFAWVPCLLIAAILQIRAIYLKKIMVSKYGFNFPKRFLGIVRTDELKTNRRMTESQNLKEIITSFIETKKWIFRLLIAAIIIIVGPYLFKWWISDSRKTQ
jgi:hypothetical protein